MLSRDFCTVRILNTCHLEGDNEKIREFYRQALFDADTTHR